MLKVGYIQTKHIFLSNQVKKEQFHQNNATNLFRLDSFSVSLEGSNLSAVNCVEEVCNVGCILQNKKQENHQKN